MEKSGEKKVVADFMPDRISALPDSLIDYILERLSGDIHVVVRTSVLSKRWRFCWTRVRQLDFGVGFYINYGRQRGLDVVEIVESILSRHDGPVDQFRVFARSSPRLGMGRPFDMCPWIKLLSEKRICEIEFLGTPLCYLDSPCISKCTTLTHLILQFCKFGPFGDFGVFNNLVYLSLDMVRISGTSLETLISHSPQLRVLELTEICIEDNYLVVVTAPELQNLYLKECGGFCLKEYPNLTSAYLGSEFEVPMISYERTSKLDIFVQLMPKVEQLKLNPTALNALAVGGDVPMKIHRILENLKYLEFEDLDILSQDQLSCFFCLVRSSPNLKSLQINFPYSIRLILDDAIFHDMERAFMCYEAQQRVGMLSRLSKVTFYSLVGDYCEVKFISTFINLSPMLETAIFISHPNPGVDIDSKEWLSEVLGKLWIPRPVSVSLKFEQEPVENPFIFYGVYR